MMTNRRMPSKEFLQQIRGDFEGITVDQLAEELSQFELSNDVQLNDYQRVVSDESLFERIEQHLGVLPTEYYTKANVTYGGQWPSTLSRAAITTRTKSLKARFLWTSPVASNNGQPQLVGTIEYSIYPSGSHQRDDLEDTFQPFGIDTKKNSIEINKVRIEHAFQMVKVDPKNGINSTDNERGVYLRTMLLAEFLRQAFHLSVKVDLVFMVADWREANLLDPHAPDRLSNINAGLYNDLHVEESSQSGFTVLMYREPTAVASGPVKPSERKRGIDIDYTKYGLVEISEAPSPSRLYTVTHDEQRHHWELLSEPSRGPLLTAHFSITTGDPLQAHIDLKPTDATPKIVGPIGEMYYALLTEVLGRLKRQLELMNDLPPRYNRRSVTIRVTPVNATMPSESWLLLCLDVAVKQGDIVEFDRLDRWRYSIELPPPRFVNSVPLYRDLCDQLFNAEEWRAIDAVKFIEEAVRVLEEREKSMEKRQRALMGAVQRSPPGPSVKGLDEFFPKEAQRLHAARIVIREQVDGLEKIKMTIPHNELFYTNQGKEYWDQFARRYIEEGQRRLEDKYTKDTVNGAMKFIESK